MTLGWAWFLLVAGVIWAVSTNAQNALDRESREEYARWSAQNREPKPKNWREALKLLLNR
jgi:hypothetical protein